MTTTTVDRPAAIRRALRDLVAENGFHGTSMSAVAKAAGVATGTAYVHYESKEDLVHATYLEIKRDLGEAVMARVDVDAAPHERFLQIWLGTYEHLAEEPARAKFLAQIEVSPFFEGAYRLVKDQGDRIAEEAVRADLAELLVDLPGELLYSLSLGSAVRVVASGLVLTLPQRATLAEASWRAVTVPE